jgi:hypothetical protein
MRKLLHFLFPIAALTIALMGSSRAEAPAITDDQIRAFIARAQDALDEANLRAYRAEHRADSCQAFLKDHHA